jgi:hypothetical protein
MGKSVLYIVGAVVLLGGGAFLFLRNKNQKDALLLADLETKKALEVEKVDEKQAVAEDKKDLLTANDLLTITKLQEEIISLTRQRNGFRKASSKANVQVLIDEKIVALRNYGFALGMNNELISLKK